MATNSLGELQWQYQMNGNWRTLSDNHCRMINVACEKNAISSVPVTEVELVVRGKPFLAKWLPDATSNPAPDEFARLVSFEPVAEPAAVVDVGQLGGDQSSVQQVKIEMAESVKVATEEGAKVTTTVKAEAEATAAPPAEPAPVNAEAEATAAPPAEPVPGTVVVSATEQLRQRQKAQAELLVDEHTRLVAAELALQADLRQGMKDALENEDAETKAARAAMHTHTRAASKAAADAHRGDPADKRSRRIQFGTLYAAGVAAYRSRPPPPLADATTATPAAHTAPASAATSPPSVARVLVRARPLFAHEAERGEWAAVSALPRGVVVHEGVDAMRKGEMVHKLRHHTFGDVRTVGTDTELYESVRYLVRHAAGGGLATLFCYGMTGSGKVRIDGIVACHTRIASSIHHEVRGTFDALPFPRRTRWTTSIASCRPTSYR